MQAGYVVVNECGSNESTTEQPDNLDGRIADLQDGIYKNYKKHALASTEAPTHKLDVLSKRMIELRDKIDENHENNMLALTEWHTHRLDDQYMLSTELQDEMTKTRENWEHEYTEYQRSKDETKTHVEEYVKQNPAFEELCLLKKRSATMLEKERRVMSIKIQMYYWIISTCFVAIHHYWARDALLQSEHASFIVGFALAFGLSHSLSDNPWVRYWSIFLLTNCAGLCVEPALIALSTTKPTHRQVVLIPWCFTFFTVTEAKWHHHLHSIMCHPPRTDMVPSQYEHGFSAFRDLFISLCHYWLTWFVGLAILWALRYVGDVPGDRYWLNLHHSDARFATDWKGQIFQIICLLRPLRHLTAWVTNGIVMAAVALWTRTRDYFRGRRGRELV
jgi:hypothetical protein